MTGTYESKMTTYQRLIFDAGCDPSMPSIDGWDGTTTEQSPIDRACFEGNEVRYLNPALGFKRLNCGEN